MLDLINRDVEIDFKLTPLMQNLVNDAEEACANDDYNYYNIASSISVIGKELCVEGFLTEKQWHTLERRYPE